MTIIGSDWEDELVRSMERSRPERERRYKKFKQKVNGLVEELNEINQRYDAVASLYHQKEYLKCLKRGFYTGFDFNPIPRSRPTSEKNRDLDAITELRSRHSALIEESTTWSLLGTISLIKLDALEFCDEKLLKNIDSLETMIDYTLNIVRKTKTTNTP